MAAINERFDGIKPLVPTNNLDKKTSRVLELQRLLEYRFKFDVVEELINLYSDEETKNSDKRQILETLMKYQYPQLKAIELDSRDGEKICVNIVFPDDTSKSVRVSADAQIEELN